MKLFRETKGMVPCARAVTIGNFDGAHLGHQQLIEQLKNKSKELNVRTCLITFEPQPNEFFTHSVTPARLTRFREKFLALERCNLDEMLCLRFNQDLASLPPEEFVKTILMKGLQAKYILVGDDFRFGYRRQGDIRLLKQLGLEYGFEAEAMDTVLVNQERVSSSRIRAALACGELNLAKTLLGRPFTMSGKVAHGNKLGKALGFPTANIHLNRRAVPINGIFAVKIHGLSDLVLLGVANVGNRPAVGGGKTLLEVYIFDFSNEIYGKHITVEFVHKLRDEENYTSLELLKAQIAKDVQAAKEYFSKHKSK